MGTHQKKLLTFKTERTTVLLTLCPFLFVSFSCLGQTVNCDQKFTTVMDRTSHGIAVHARKNIVVSADGGKTGFAIHGGCANQTVAMTIRSVGAGACVNEGDAIQLVFTDSTKVELANMAEFNCQAQSSVYFSKAIDNIGQLQLLGEKQIAVITVWTKKKYLSRSVSDQESKEIRELFSCLLETLNSKSTLNEERVFTVVEAQPEYIGGYGAMMAFIKENLHIPKEWRKQEVIGTVDVQSTIAKDGSVTEVKTVKSLHPDLDQEAERVIKNDAPLEARHAKWKPVLVTFRIPVSFN